MSTKDAAKTALLLIDAQQSFEHAPYWSPVDTPRFYERTQILIDGAKSRGMALAQVFHVEDAGPFSIASGYVKPLSALQISPHAIFQKPRHSAFVASGLPVWLVEHDIRHLLIAGIRTEQCCETTTRHAADSGYSVDFVMDATLTFAMQDKRGRRWSAEEIKMRTELVLEGRFARVVDVERALAVCDETASA